MNFHVIVVTFAIAISCLTFEIFNLVIVMICMGFLYYSELWVQREKKSMSATKFFRIVRGYIIFILAIHTALKIPAISNWILNHS